VHVRQVDKNETIVGSIEICAALEKLTPLVYDELHRLARRYMRHESPGHTMQTSALVNEAYLKLVDQKKSAGRTAVISLPLPRS